MTKGNCTFWTRGQVAGIGRMKSYQQVVNKLSEGRLDSSIPTQLPAKVGIERIDRAAQEKLYLVGLKAASLHMSACQPLSLTPPKQPNFSPSHPLNYCSFKLNEAPTIRNIACSAAGRSSECSQVSERSLLFDFRSC